jgi:hypothetical protein
MKFDIKRKLNDSAFVESLSKIANTNFVAKSMVSLFVWFIALIPAYIFFLIRWAVDPTGFWQEIFLLLVVGIFAGPLQVGCIVIAVAITVMLIFDEF